MSKNYNFGDASTTVAAQVQHFCSILIWINPNRYKKPSSNHFLRSNDHWGLT